MYQALHLPWVPDLLAEQRVAGILALVIGELVLLGILAVLLTRWGQLEDWVHRPTGTDDGPGHPRAGVSKLPSR
jgi:putative copper resistance protein D